MAIAAGAIGARFLTGTSPPPALLHGSASAISSNQSIFGNKNARLLLTTQLLSRSRIIIREAVIR